MTCFRIVKLQLFSHCIAWERVPSDACHRQYITKFTQFSIGFKLCFSDDNLIIQKKPQWCTMRFLMEPIRFSYKQKTILNEISMYSFISNEIRIDTKRYIDMCMIWAFNLNTWYHVKAWVICHFEYLNSFVSSIELFSRSFYRMAYYINHRIAHIYWPRN